MSDDEDIAALVVDNGSGMCKGEQRFVGHFRTMLLMTTTTANTTTANTMTTTEIERDICNFESQSTR